MLINPGISDDTIITSIYESFGLPISQVTFLPLGFVDNAIYRLSTSSGVSYLLKLRRGEFNDSAVTVPAFLHAQGIQQVIAPIATSAQTLWVNQHGFDWTLYPYFNGVTGFETALSKQQWITLGTCMKSVHSATLPAALAEHIPQEDFSPRWRDRVKAFHEQVKWKRYADPTAASFAHLWSMKRDEIQCMVERAETLAYDLQSRNIELAVCHSDLHGRNVMVGASDEIAIVDWDEPILAPKERDLMFIGGGIGGIWNDDRETQWFYQGYGRSAIDPIALAYYRYERVVVDIAVISERIFGMQGSVEDRQKGLRLVEQFQPDNVVDIAHRTYEKTLAR